LLFLLNLRKRFLNWIERKEKILILKKMILVVNTFEEFKKIALELDRLEGKEEWKFKKDSDLYDYREVDKLIYTLKVKKKDNDINGVSHYLRSNLLKNLYSTNNPELFNHTHYGTKFHIEKFEKEITSCLKFVYQFDESKFPLNKKLEFFSESRHAYGRTALLLSGGASFGMYHIGVVKALYEQNLLPK
jgi:TAG lipase/lysophosphatidylethanolamine acyltransferase